jgi:hypothetical protein
LLRQDEGAFCRKNNRICTGFNKQPELHVNALKKEGCREEQMFTDEGGLSFMAEDSAASRYHKFKRAVF